MNIAGLQSLLSKAASIAGNEAEIVLKAVEGAAETEIKDLEFKISAGGDQSAKVAVTHGPVSETVTDQAAEPPAETADPANVSPGS